MSMRLACVTALALSLASPAVAVELHTIDVLGNTLVTLDTQTGAVTTVGFTGLPFINYDMTLLDGSIWAISQFGAVHQLFRIDPETGQQLDSEVVLVEGSPTGRSPGLAARSGELIVVFDPVPKGHNASHLGTLNLDGSITDVVSFEQFDADLFGLATGPDGDSLFSVGGNATGQLRRMTLDPVTFETIGGDGLGNVNDLVFVGDDLWGLDSIAQDFTFLFRIDPDDGEILETVQIQVLPGQSLFSGLAFVSCAGDFDADGIVGVPDLLGLLAAWGPNPGHAADLDGDGVVGVPDLLSLLGVWGVC